MSETQQTEGQPSPEEIRAYLEQLRNADVAEIVVQAWSLLGTGAEVKIGRPDARLLIDAMAALEQTISGQLPEQLAQQMRSGISQLQMAQVQAEREAVEAQQAPEQPAEPAGAPPAGAPQTGASQSGQQPQGPAPGGGQGEDQRMTDRLWVPGRGQSPPGGRR